MFFKKLKKANARIKELERELALSNDSITSLCTSLDRAHGRAEKVKKTHREAMETYRKSTDRLINLQATTIQMFEARLGLTQEKS